MSGRLLAIKKKIRATKNTRKITSAMQLVAASKMRNFQKKALNSREYAWNLLRVLQKNLHEIPKTALMEERGEGKILFVVYTSDKGLCGALNTRILKTLATSRLWNETPEEERLVITIGKKSYDYVSYRHIPVEKSFTSINEKMTLMEAVDFVEVILNYWKHHNVRQVVMLAPHYKNSLVYYPVVKTYLPFSEEMISEHFKADPDDFDTSREMLENEYSIIFEPDKQRFAEVLVEQLVYTLFMQSFFELKAAEYSSRMIAMQNATDAAGEIIDRLSLSYNKARQAAITQEIAEVVGGSMA